jgi:phage shock protein A
MATLLQKVRTAILATAHSLVDMVIDLNSVEAVKQHIRDLGTAKDELNHEAAVARGNVRTLGRRKEALEGKIESKNEDLDFILTDGDQSNDTVALKLEMTITELEGELVLLTEEILAAEETANTLEEQASNVEAKYAQMVGQLRRLESMERTARAKEKATRALKMASTLSDPTGVDIDNVAQDIQARADVADAEFKKTIDSVDTKIEGDVALARAKKRLEERKARLNQQQQ